MDHQQLYLELYKEYRAEIRHQEAQRSAVSTICVGFAAALIGFGLKEGFTARPMLGVLLVNFSVVAILMLRKLYERFALGKERAYLYLEQVDKCPRLYTSEEGKLVQCKNPPLLEIWEDGRKNNEKSYPFMSYVRLHYLWEVLLIGSGLIGILFVVDVPLTVRWIPYFLAIAGVVTQFAAVFVLQRKERREALRDYVRRLKKREVQEVLVDDIYSNLRK